MRAKCVICGKWDHPNKMNGIYRKGGTHYYCKKKLCQEILIRDAGELPEEIEGK